MYEAKRNIHKIRKDHQKVSIILLAAGPGNRMKSLGVRSLIRLPNGDSIIEHQLKTINSVFNNNEIILVTGYDADKVMNKTPSNIIKVENERFETTNVARSISIGLRACTTDFVFVIYGDLLFNEETLKIPLDNSSLLIDSHGLMKDSQIGCNVDNNQVELLLYGLEDKWAQITYLTGKELKLYKNIAWNRNNEKKFGFELINEVIDSGGKFIAIKNILSKIFDIDSGKDLEKVKYL